MITLDDLQNRATITVPEAGQILGIGRDAAYAAAERDEIPVLHLGRRLVVPVPRLLQLLGVLPQDSEPVASTATGIANDSPTHQETRHVDSQAHRAHGASVHPIRGV